MSQNQFLTLDDIQPNGKRVLVRVDLNVPMQNGQVTDTTRIDKVLPTLTELAQAGAKVIVMAHLGRPKGQVVPEFSLRPVYEVLAKKLSPLACSFAENCVGPAAEAAVAEAQPGSVIVLENIRFHAGEEKNDADFTNSLAALGDLYVNEAFSASHRAHASTEGLAHALTPVAGRLMQAELQALDQALSKPTRPVMAIVGGAKVSTKIDLLENLVQKVDFLAIGGGMANTFLHALGQDVGASLCEKDLAAKAQSILAAADKAGCTILLPQDVVAADGFAANSPSASYPVSAVPQDKMILDIGPETAATWQAHLATCKTVVWNGPVGAFELEPFDKGSLALADTIATLTSKGSLLSVAGGGDTIAALVKAKQLDALSYVSTAGGAFLEWLEGKTLPGVAALTSSPRMAHAHTGH